jgi:hypothetical protein
MNDKPRAGNRYLAAAAVASLLLAAPLAATAQTDAALTDAQTSGIRSLTSQLFDDVHNGNVADFAAITTPDFAVTNPDGSTMGAPDLFARSMVRYLDEGGSDRAVRVDSITSDGTNITEDVSVNEYSTPVLSGDVTDTAQVASYSSRTLTWTPAPDGTWLLASEKINSLDRVED